MGIPVNRPPASPFQEGTDVFTRLAQPYSQTCQIRCRENQNHNAPHSTNMHVGINPEYTEPGQLGIWWGLESSYEVSDGGHRQAEAYLQFTSIDFDGLGGGYSRRPFAMAIHEDGATPGRVVFSTLADQVSFLSIDGATTYAFVSSAEVRVGPGVRFAGDTGSYFSLKNSASAYRNVMSWDAVNDRIILAANSDPVQVTGAFAVNGATPQTRITVTGSRGSNAALASLLTALESIGLITDSTT